VRCAPVSSARGLAIHQEPSSQKCLKMLAVMAWASMPGGRAGSTTISIVVMLDGLVVSSAALQKDGTLRTVVPASAHEHGCGGGFEVGDGINCLAEMWKLVGTVCDLVPA
jgi:hypothetical protein